MYFHQIWNSKLIFFILAILKDDAPPPHTWCLIYLMVAFRIFSLCLFSKFWLCCTWMWISLFILSLVFPVPFGFVSWNFLNQILEVFGHYFFKYFSAKSFISSHSRIQITHVFTNLKYSHRTLVPCLVFFPDLIFLVYFYLDNYYWYLFMFNNYFFHFCSICC